MVVAASPDACMMLSDLDGFLHGIACSPVLIFAEEWMVVALGAPEDALPEEIVRTVASRYAEICKGLALGPPEVEPVFWQNADGDVIAMDWCEGVMQAVGLRPRNWLRLTESGTHGQLMTPIIAHLLDAEGDSVLGIPPEDLEDVLEQAAESLPASIAGIHRFWASNHA